MRAVDGCTVYCCVLVVVWYGWRSTGVDCWLFRAAALPISLFADDGRLVVLRRMSVACVLWLVVSVVMFV